MTPLPPNHVCVPCGVAWHHHDTLSPCWNCGTAQPRNGLAVLFQPLGRCQPGWDGPTVYAGGPT